MDKQRHTHCKVYMCLAFWHRLFIKLLCSTVQLGHTNFDESFAKRLWSREPRLGEVSCHFQRVHCGRRLWRCMSGVCTIWATTTGCERSEWIDDEQVSFLSFFFVPAIGCMNPTNRKELDFTSQAIVTRLLCVVAVTCTSVDNTVIKHQLMF